MASGKTERNFVRVNRVHLTVVDANHNVASIRTCQRTLFHAVHDAFNDGRYEASVDSATHDAVVNHELAAPFQLDFLTIFYVELEFLTAETIGVRLRHAFNVRFDNQVHFAELT